ncbi:MAG: hypothetical protein RSD29_03890 [Bacilli bacterium]
MLKWMMQMNLYRLVLITFKSFFKLDKKGSKGRRLSIIKLLLLLGLFFYFGFFVYLFANSTMQGLILMHSEKVILGEFFVIGSIFILLSSVLKIDGVLYTSKDYDLLMSLPIKQSTIITSKMIVLYLANLLTVLVLLIPSLLVYTKYVSVSLLFYLFFFITLLIIPLIPTIIAVLIGTFIISFSSRFKFKKLLKTIMLLCFTFGLVFISSKFNSMNNIDMANLGNSLINMLNKVYPFTNMYLDILVNYNLLSLVLFCTLPVIIYIVFTLILSKFFPKIISRLKSTNTNKKYKLSNIKFNNQTVSLYKKELKRYFSSPIYVLNTIMGMIMLLISVGAIVIFGLGKFESILEMEGIKEIIFAKCPLLFGMFILLSCTTHASISLEGKNLWILQSIPVSTTKIFLSKVLVNITVTLPISLIACLVIGTYLHFPFTLILLSILTCLVYSIFSAIFGLFINLIFPKLDWQNEVYVIKQSTASFIIYIGGVIIGILPVAINLNINSNLYILLVNIILILLIGVLVLYLEKFGKNKFRKLV